MADTLTNIIVSDRVHADTFNSKIVTPSNAKFDSIDTQLAENTKYKNDFINVQEFYGAVGDGITDDTIALQNAFSSSNNIYIPAGNYKVSNVLYITGTNKKIFCNGVIVSTVSRLINRYLIEMQGNNILIDGLRLTTDYGSNEWMRRPEYEFINDARTIPNPLYTQWHDLRFNIFSEGILIIDSQDITVTNCHVEHVSGGIIIGNSTRIIINKNRIIETFADGIFVSSGSHDVEVTNNIVENLGDDCFTFIGYDQNGAYNCVCANNMAYNCARHLIACVNSHDITITNTNGYKMAMFPFKIWYENLGTGVLSPYNIMISNCNVWVEESQTRLNTTENSAEASIQGLNVNPLKNISITGCSVKRNVSAYYRRVLFKLFENFNINGCFFEGFHIMSQDFNNLSIVNNVIISTGLFQVWKSSFAKNYGFKFVDNYFKNLNLYPDNTLYDIYLQSTDDFTITGNTIDSGGVSKTYQVYVIGTVTQGLFDCNDIALPNGMSGIRCLGTYNDKYEVGYNSLVDGQITYSPTTQKLYIMIAGVRKEIPYTI